MNTVRSAPARTLVEELDHVLATGAIHSAYQPVVDLDDGRTVGWEALARGPAGSPLERPDHLFEAARAARRTPDLDWLCRGAAVRGALQAGVRPPFTLFVNVEPAALHQPVPHEAKALWREAAEGLRIVLEITERALIANPTDLLWSIAGAREQGWGVALDDVGADPRSLAMLPFIRPDVIKLDLRLIQNRPSRDAAAIVHAVSAEAERTGAVVLAEGIETERHRATAAALGATLGQGWLFGRPRALPESLPRAGRPVRIEDGHWKIPAGRTPFDLLRELRPVHRGSKAILFAMSRQLEERALALGERPVVLSTFQDERFFTPPTRSFYERLAAGSSFVAAFGAGMGPAPAPGVRGASLRARDPLTEEWVVAVLGSHFSGAFAARDLGDDAVDHERRFDYAATYDRELVITIALSLMARVLAV